MENIKDNGNNKVGELALPDDSKPSEKAAAQPNGKKKSKYPKWAVIMISAISIAEIVFLIGIRNHIDS